MSLLKVPHCMVHVQHTLHFLLNTNKPKTYNYLIPDCAAMNAGVLPECVSSSYFEQSPRNSHWLPINVLPLDASCGTPELADTTRHQAATHFYIAEAPQNCTVPDASPHIIPRTNSLIQSPISGRLAGLYSREAFPPLATAGKIIHKLPNRYHHYTTMAFLHKSYLLFLACIGLALALADGADPHVDHGTCGNACCKIHFGFAASTKEVLKRVTNALSKNPSYSPQLMNE